jgi:lipid-A-disaccharide synthase
MRDIAERMSRDGYMGYKFIIPTVETTAEYVRNETAHWRVKPILVPSSERYDIYSKTYIAIAASGTVSAELAMLHVPTIVVYKMNAITTMIARLLVNIKWVSLVNILLNRTVFPEFLGPNATVDNIMDAVQQLTIPSKREKMISDLESADKLWLPGKNGAATMIADGIKKSA